MGTRFQKLLGLRQWWPKHLHVAATNLFPRFTSAVKRWNLSPSYAYRVLSLIHSSSSFALGSIRITWTPSSRCGCLNQERHKCSKHKVYWSELPKSTAKSPSHSASTDYTLPSSLNSHLSESSGRDSSLCTSDLWIQHIRGPYLNYCIFSNDLLACENNHVCVRELPDCLYAEPLKGTRGRGALI